MKIGSRKYSVYFESALTIRMALDESRRCSPEMTRTKFTRPRTDYSATNCPYRKMDEVFSYSKNFPPL